MIGLLPFRNLVVMKNLLGSLTLAIVLLCSVVSAQTPHFITDTPGSIRTTTWWVLIRTNDLGVVVDWNGDRGDDYPTIEGKCNRILLASDPGGIPDTVLSGVSSAGSWTVRINFSKKEGITRIWGQDATGQFWIGALSPTKIRLDDTKPNRKALPREID